jgi:hypothetical protein
MVTNLAIDIEDIIDMQVACAVKGGKLLTTIKLSARISSDSLGKLVRLQERKVPLYATIGTNQIEMEPMSHSGLIKSK